MLKTSKLVRQLIFEWNAQKVAVVTPFESSLNQLYSLIHFYSPEFLYVVAETEVSGKLDPLKRKLEREGIRVPRVSVLRMRSPDLDDHVRMAEDLVSKAGIVCISGDSAAICVALALAATKLKKTMCHVITSDQGSRNPFQVSKVVTM